MHFIYSKDDFLLKKEINQILKNFNGEFEIETFSFVDDSFEKIIQAFQTFPLFSEKKVIILKDCWFVSDTRNALHKSFNLDTLMNVLQKGINENCELIFSLNSDKFSKKSKTANWFKTNMEVKFVDYWNRATLENFILQNFQQADKKISNQAVEFLINFLPNDLQIINGEIQKLLLLNHNIELVDVQENLTKYFEQDIFEISNYFLANDLENFLIQYQNFRLTNNDNLPLIALLSNNLAILRNALILEHQNLTFDEIAKKIDVNSYRLKLLLKANKNTINELNGRIIMLYELNKNLILGKVDNQVIPEYEFIKILSNN